jgi:Flp pilus assembly protein CpaB
VLSRRPPPDPGRVSLRRRTGTVRRLASAALVAAAVATGLLALSDQPPAGTPVLVAARDLAAGTVLTARDVQLDPRSPGQLPDGTLTSTRDVVGRVLASGTRRGEVLTDVRLVGPSLVDTLGPGQVAVPVRVADAAVAALVAPGDHVDVLVAVDGGGPAQTVVTDATVLARPGSTGSGGLLGTASADGQGGLVVLGAGGQDARALAGAAAHGPLSLTLRGT